MRAFLPFWGGVWDGGLFRVNAMTEWMDCGPPRSAQKPSATGDLLLELFAPTRSKRDRRDEAIVRKVIKCERVM